jgi:hypothetical protein
MENLGNLETVRELYRSNDMDIITQGGTDHRKVAGLDTFRRRDLSNRSFSSIDNN